MEEKKCARCRKILPVSEFYIRKDRNKPHSYCKSCCIKNLNAVTDSRYRKTKHVQDYKESKGCFFCDMRIGICLDLHHTDPTVKDQAVSAMFTSHKSLLDIYEEVRKCVVICSNHHRMVHAGLLEIPVVDDDYFDECDRIIDTLS